MRVPLTTALAVLALAFLPAVLSPEARAAPGFGPNVKVNEAAGTGADQYWPVLEGNATTLVAVWEDYRDSPIDPNLYSARSTDGGATWSAPNPKVSDDVLGEAQYDVDLVASASGFYAVWVDNREFTLEPDVYFSRTLDGGLTWSPNIRINSAPSMKQNSPAIATDGTDLFVVWRDFRAGVPDIWFSNSSDGGQTWAPDKTVHPTDSLIQSAPDVATDGSQVYVAWTDDPGGDFRVWFSNSSDGGQTWAPRVRVDDAPGTSLILSMSLVATPGLLVVAWQDDRNGDVDIYTANSTDGGQTWSAAVRSNDDATATDQEAVSLAADGSSLHLVWRDGRKGEQDIYYSESTDGGASWGANILVNDDAAGAVQWNPDIATMNGETYVVWEDDRNGGGTYDVFVTGRLPEPPPVLPNPPTGVHARLVAGGQDVEITWTPPANESGVDHYELWRGDVYAMSATGYAILPAAANLPPGSSGFVDDATLPGASHFYEVRAVGLGGLASGDYQAAKYIRDLPAGMSLLSVPVLLQDGSLASAVQSLSAVAVTVRAFDPADGPDPWKAGYFRTPTGDLNTADLTHGLWVNLSAPAEWRVAGRVPLFTTVPLESGWNLVGYPSFLNRSAAAALAGLSVTRIEAWSAELPYSLRSMAFSETMTTGSAYWLYVQDPDLWSLTNMGDAGP